MKLAKTLSAIALVATICSVGSVKASTGTDMPTKSEAKTLAALQETYKTWQFIPQFTVGNQFQLDVITPDGNEHVGDLRANGTAVVDIDSGKGCIDNLGSKVFVFNGRGKVISGRHFCFYGPTKAKR